MLYKWWKSKHKLIYLLIAIKHFTNPSRVMLIAHGLYDHKGKIIHDLIKWGVLKNDNSFEDNK